MIVSWNMKKYGVTSVTAKQSESFNQTLKELNGWKEFVIDNMVKHRFLYCEASPRGIVRFMQPSSVSAARHGDIRTPQIPDPF